MINMINKYTKQEACVFLNTSPSYGYHTTVYGEGFLISIKEYRLNVSIDIKFGQTPNGAAGFGLVVQKIGSTWTLEVEEICQAALNKDFSIFPWVAGGSAQSFAEQCFALNETVWDRPKKTSWSMGKPYSN